MPNTKPYNKEEVMKELKDSIYHHQVTCMDCLHTLALIQSALTLAEQAGEERMKKPLREALRMLEDEIPYTSEEVVMRIKEALK